MKLILTGIAFACLVYACGKKDAPAPVTPPVVPPVVNTALAITGFAPESAEPGAEITITGTNFGSVAGDVAVTFGSGTAVTPKSVSANKVVVAVPAGAVTGKIAIAVNGATALSKNDFIVIKNATTLSITDFTPKSAKPFEKITITGTGFTGTPATLKMAIDNSPYFDVLSVSPTTIVVQTNLATPSGKISVTINGTKVTSATDFTALLADLAIIDMSGAAGQIRKGQLGRRMSMQANGFGTDTNKIFISFGGTKPVKADYVGPAGAAVGTIIPRYAQSGKVTLTVDGRSVTSIQDFNLEMSMRDFSPQTVSTGDTMKITGVAFTTKEDMSVNFNSDLYIERPIKVTPTELWVIVPSYAKTGNVMIGAQLATITDFIIEKKFTFIPRVSFNDSLTPASGKLNNVIRINGSFANADVSDIGVSFGGSKPVQPESVSGPNILVKIPPDAKTGRITISRKGYAPFTGTFIFTIVP